MDHAMWGTDQSASLEVHGMSILKRRMDDVEAMLGSDEKIITESELPIRMKLRGN